jgi:hypothetical protein
MSSYELQTDLFLLPTPAGAYYSISADDKDKPRLFLRQLLQQEQTPELNEENLLKLSLVESVDKAKELLHHCQQIGWVQGVPETLNAPQGALEAILPDLLRPISETDKVLLADDQGFYLACSGFAHETAEELSALSAEIATAHNRRAGLLNNNLGVSSQAWSIVDAYGNSQIGFWPVFIGSHRFVIVVAGTPHFNRMEFVKLTWALTLRYASSRAK